MKTMELDLKATTLTDKGEVRLLVSTYDRDRVGDVVAPGAWASTIQQWKASGRNIPVHYDHGSSAEDIIGAADPASMAEVNEGLVVDAKLDLEGSERAREVWRSIKAGVISCSFGYMADSQPLEGGGELLTKIDLFEVTLTPSPCNPQARVLDYKGNRSAPVVDEFAEWPSLEQFNREQARKRAEAETKRLAKPLQLASFPVES